jgi:hypothetical protein
MVEIISHNHASELISLSGAYLEQNESENNRVLGLAYKLTEAPHYQDSKPRFLLSILEQGKAVGVAIMVPWWQSILSKFDTQIQPAMAHLVRYLREADVQIPKIHGPAPEAQAFSDCWIEGMPNVSAEVAMRMRTFEASAVADLPLSQGKLRLACMEDLPLMAQWHAAYLEETWGVTLNFHRAKSYAEQGIKDQELYIWDHDGPISIVRTDRPTKNGIAIHTVYTPPEHRNKGYATSSVLLLTKKLLAEGYSFCCLHTDLANPTSNSIYTKIGYVPMGDALEFDFVSSDKHSGT